MEKPKNTISGDSDFLISHIEMIVIKWMFYDEKWSMEAPESVFETGYKCK